MIREITEVKLAFWVIINDIRPKDTEDKIKAKLNDAIPKKKTRRLYIASASPPLGSTMPIRMNILRSKNSINAEIRSIRIVHLRTLY
jgi:hypothetical protein